MGNYEGLKILECSCAQENKKEQGCWKQCSARPQCQICPSFAHLKSLNSILHSCGYLTCCEGNQEICHWAGGLQSLESMVYHHLCSVIFNQNCCQQLSLSGVRGTPDIMRCISSKEGTLPCTKRWPQADVGDDPQAEIWLCGCTCKLTVTVWFGLMYLYPELQSKSCFLWLINQTE